MTEAEWLQQEPRAMLESLIPRPSTRKHRLLAVALCRQIVKALPSVKNKTRSRILRVVEDVADQPSLHPTLAAMHAEQTANHQACSAGSSLDWYVRGVFVAALHPVASMSAVETLGALRLLVEHVGGNTSLGIRGETASRFVMRDMFLNQLQSPLAPPSTSGLKNIAMGIYGGDFDSFPILADALEEAGCMDEAILSHCRGPGPHVRGCWVIDLLLGKE